MSDLLGWTVVAFGTLVLLPALAYLCTKMAVSGYLRAKELHRRTQLPPFKSNGRSSHVPNP